MSIVRCELHGNIDTDFDAEHFIEGTEICTESAMTPEDIKKITPEGYGGDFEQTVQTSDIKKQPILLIGTVRSVDMYRRANFLNPNNSKRISRLEDAKGYREIGEVLAVGDWYRFNDILNLSRELEEYGFTIRSVQA